MLRVSHASKQPGCFLILKLVARFCQFSCLRNTPPQQRYLFIYLSGRERASEHELGVMVQREKGSQGSLLSRFNPRTPGLGPELKTDAQPTDPPLKHLLNSPLFLCVGGYCLSPKSPYFSCHHFAFTAWSRPTPFRVTVPSLPEGCMCTSAALK